MTESQRIQLRQSRIRERLAEISRLEGDAYDDAIRKEETDLQGEYSQAEIRFRTALISEEKELSDAKVAAGDGIDAEARERIELRSKASLTNYLLSAARGRLVDGPEAELCAAAGVGDGAVPLELWDTPPEQRAVTGAPGTVGVNLAPILPAVFAPSIAPKLGISMPRVASGTFASATISASTTAAPRAKSADAPETAATFSVTTSAPKRVSARLALTLESIAEVGQANFESALRQNLSLALSDELDRQAISGDGVSPNLTGILQRLTDPNAPSGVADFDDFVASFADGVDGLWASTLKDVSILCGPATYKLSAKTFRDIASADLGAESFADYAARLYGGWFTNKRMPDPASNVQAGILYRMGRAMMGDSLAAMTTAICATWGSVAIDDVYSGSAKAERYFTLHALVSDIIVTQPDSYTKVSFQTA